MIARILYRENVHGVMNYVLQKTNAEILGFQNTSPLIEESPEYFKGYLHSIGSRHETKKRYAHFTINLPHGEYLSNNDFYRLAEEYMQQMGYADQPFVVVRHDDTKHEHIHIVTTTVKEDNTLVNLSHDYTRNIATQKYLEKKFGLMPSPETKSEKELPVLRLPEMHPIPDDSNGIKFYLQDILNMVVQKHKVRSFNELTRLVEPYHIIVKPVKHSVRMGVSYGIQVNNGYKSRFINGYVVHPSLSGTKMESLFKRNSRSKLLPMHRKRLEKQILTTYKLFKNIRPEDLPTILKPYQNIESQLRLDKKNAVHGLTIYDKSGYVFDSIEINSIIDQNLKLSDHNETKTALDLSSKQFALEIRKIIKETIFYQYLNNRKKGKLLSEFVLTKNFRELMPHIINSERFVFLSQYIHSNPNPLINAIQKEFESTRNLLHSAEVKKEIEVLNNKVQLIKDVLHNSIFDPLKKDELLFELIQSVGTKYSKGRISFINSNVHHIELELGKMMLPESTTPYVSTGFIKENSKVLEYLLGIKEVDEKSIRANAMFLPMIFPKLYEGMRPDCRKKYEETAIRAYQKTAEKFHSQFEKSPLDYITMLISKGFYFEQIEDKMYIHSIYGKQESAVILSKKTQAYLKCVPNLKIELQNQYEVINKLRSLGNDKLQNLWASYLIERGLYDKAAFLIVYDGIRPNLSSEAIEYHMNNGLKDKILVISKQKIDNQHRKFLRKSVYAFSSLMGNRNTKEEEMFNGFKDELTDYSRYKKVFV